MPKNKVLAFLLSLVFLSLPSQGGTVVDFYFIEVKSFKEIEGLPPKLEVTFDIFCNQKFVKVVRHEITDPKTKDVSIALGVLVEESKLSSCAGESKEMTVPAGTTFSGRKFEISKIKPQRL